MKKNSIWKILIYFIIYSILGYLLETVYAVFTKGTIESRQSFLYGPFCIIYGIAAICIIFTLQKYKKQNLKLFVYGLFVGCLVEYFSSYIAEFILHVKWWDYSNDFLNIHGRTCLYYAVLWGLLTIALINYINPELDKIIDALYKKLSTIFIKSIVTIITLFMTFDGLISCYAIDNFLLRVANEYNININGIDSSKSFASTFSNEQMMMTYPNIIVVNKKNENILLENVLKDVKNYYYKF